MSGSAKAIVLNRPLDLFFFLSHLVIALLAGLMVEMVAHLAMPVRALIIVAYLLIAYHLYVWVGSRENQVTQAEHAKTQARIDEWKRLELLNQRMLGIATQFLKDRYHVLHHMVSDLTKLRTSNTLTLASFEALLDDFDKERRAQIKRALEQLSQFLTEDDYLKPDTPGRAAADLFKVTFYAVERLGADDRPSPAGVEYLVPKYRAIPNEGEPRTRKFAKSEGASGKAWATKKMVVCEKGGKDPVFKDMWDGGGQKALYKSMICVPAIVDIPTEGMSEVYGILTVDTPVREGYFNIELEQTWATLHQPICNLLIYCRESERLKTTVVAAVRELLAAQPAQSSER